MGEESAPAQEVGQAEGNGSARNSAEGVEQLRRLPSAQEKCFSSDAARECDSPAVFRVLGFAKYWGEARLQLSIAVPIMVVLELQSLVNLVSLSYIGHLGKLELASAGISTSLCNCTGVIVLIGMAGALETLCGQAYGAQQYRQMGIYLQRGIVVFTVACIPIALVWLNVEPLLLILGQKPEVAAMAGRYAIWLLPGLLPAAWSQAIFRFLQTQSNVLPTMAIAAVTLAVSVPANHLLIHTLDLGFRGAGLAMSLTYWINAILLTLYVLFSDKCKLSWTGLSWEAFSGLIPLLKLATASGFMVCLEYWSFEAMLFMAGLLPQAQANLSALAICLNTTGLYFMISYGIGAAASTRVSNELGAGQPGVARHATVVSVTASLLQGFLVAALIFAVRHIWGSVFASEADVKEVVAQVMPFVSLTCILDSIQAVLSGVVRGCGQQQLGASINLGAFYFLGIPASVYFGFVMNWAAPGLWFGIAVGLAMQALLLGVLIAMIDWDHQAERARALVQSEPLEADTSDLTVPLLHEQP